MLLVDSFIKDHHVLTQYQLAWEKTFEKYKMLVKKINAVTKEKNELDFLHFRLREFKEFSPSENEYEEIIAKVNSQSSIREMSQIIEEIQSGFDQFQGEKSFASWIKSSIKKLDQISNATNLTVSQLKELLHEIAHQLDEASFLSSQILSQIEIDPAELEKFEERIARYQSYFRKFGITSSNELLREVQQIEENISTIETFQTDAEMICHEIFQEALLLKKMAESLHQERLRAEKNMFHAIGEELKDLGMKNCHLAMEWLPSQTVLESLQLDILSPYGQEELSKALDILSELNLNGSHQCQILMSANQGESLIPLSKVASGGELSRMMLAFKKSLSKYLKTILFVFDEVDTGVSGRIAEAIGKKILELSQTTQIICISHLPQVAAFAQSHFRVSKKQEHQRTVSKIDCLSEQEKTEEIASLLSGKTISDSSREQAKKLIKDSKI